MIIHEQLIGGYESGRELRQFDIALFDFWQGHPPPNPAVIYSYMKWWTDKAGYELYKQSATATNVTYLVHHGGYVVGGIVAEAVYSRSVRVTVSTVDGRESDFAPKLIDWLKRIAIRFE